MACSKRPMVLDLAPRPLATVVPTGPRWFQVVPLKKEPRNFWDHPTNGIFLSWICWNRNCGTSGFCWFRFNKILFKKSHIELNIVSFDICWPYFWNPVWPSESEKPLNRPKSPPEWRRTTLVFLGFGLGIAMSVSWWIRGVNQLGHHLTDSPTKRDSMSVPLSGKWRKQLIT